MKEFQKQVSEKFKNIYVSILETTDLENLPPSCSENYYKILFIETGGGIKVDFDEHFFHSNSLFVLNVGQHFKLTKQSRGIVIYFHPDFYCIRLHDAELGCDGIIFDNVFENTFIPLNNESSHYFENIMKNIKKEIEKEDHWKYEMARTYLKQTIITASRNWFSTKSDTHNLSNAETDFTRKFSQLVEKHFFEFHSVSDYALMLNITPKNLNRKIISLKKRSPNQIIKARIILEAKRLLAHTDLSIKEIAYSIGYNDISYFNRFFKVHTDSTPQNFRNNHMEN